MKNFMILYMGILLWSCAVCMAQDTALPQGDFDIISIPIGGSVNQSLDELGLTTAPVVGLDGSTFPLATVATFSDQMEITLQAGEAVLVISAPIPVSSESVYFSCFAQSNGEPLQQSALALIDTQDTQNLGVNLSANMDIPRERREYSIEYQPKSQSVILLMQFIGPAAGEATISLEKLRVLDGYADKDYTLGATQLSVIEHFPNSRDIKPDLPPSTEGGTIGFNRQLNRTVFPNIESGSLLMISTANEDVLQISVPLEMPEIQPALTGKTIRVYAKAHVRRISGTRGILTAALFSGVTGSGGYTQHTVTSIPDTDWLEIETPVQFLNESTDVLLLILQIREGSALIAVDDVSLHARRESPYFWDSGIRSIPTSTPRPTPTRVPIPPVQPILDIPSDFFIRGGQLISDGGDIDPNDTSRFDELPQREIHISAFQADKFEVPNILYNQYWSGLEGELKARRKPGRNAFGEDFESAVINYPNHPVVSVNWEDAVAFCEWRTWHEGIQPPLAYRLPTEAEWEYMARGGIVNNSSPARRFPWGFGNIDVPVPRANYSSNINGREKDGFPYTAPVDSPLLSSGVSPFGIWQLSGNVFEWCLDLYDPNYYEFANSPVRDPMGPEETGSRERVIRGGSWNDTVEKLFVSQRESAFDLEPGSIGLRDVRIGFRCVLSSLQPTPAVTPSPTASNTPLPTATPTPVPPPSPTPRPFNDGQIITSPILNIDMVYHPTGSVARGNNALTDDFNHAKADEFPRRNITISEFFMDRVEVTVALYRQFVQETGHTNRASIDDTILANIPELPVVNVTYADALAFCAWRSAKEGITYRLPTEAEWEYAARFQSTSVYPWGNNSPAFGNANFSFEGDGFDFLAPVNAFEKGKSPLGVLNMAGNASEWCLDWYAGNYYSQSPDTNPSGPASGTARVVRGGSWIDTSANIRNAARSFRDPQSAGTWIGFRCVRSLQ